MNGKQNWNKWARVTLLLALASVATMGFTVVDRGSGAAAISADHIVCALLPEENLSYIPQDLHDRLCLDHSVDVSPSLGPVLDSTASFAQYSAALEREELLWNERYLARFRSRPDGMMERAFVTEEYNAATIWGVANTAWTGKDVGSRFGVSGSAWDVAYEMTVDELSESEGGTGWASIQFAPVGDAYWDYLLALETSETGR